MSTAGLARPRAKGESLREARSILAAEPMRSAELARRMGVTTARACQVTGNLARKGEVFKAAGVWGVVGGKPPEASDARPGELTRTARLKRSIAALLAEDQVGTGEVARRLDLAESWASRLLNEMRLDGRLEKDGRLWRLRPRGDMEADPKSLPYRWVPSEEVAGVVEELTPSPAEPSFGERLAEWIDRRPEGVDVTITIKGGGR